MKTELSTFAVRLRESIHSDFQSESFDMLALELFVLQFKNNSAYRKICEVRRVTPDFVEHWSQIPAVPTTAFKELELTSLAPGAHTAVFHSSGTTGQKPSRHLHDAESLAVYEASLWKWFGDSFPEVGELVVLTPKPKAAPHSSLVHMFETIRRNSGQSESTFTGILADDETWSIDFAATVEKLQAVCKKDKPLTLLGTAFSFVHLLDYMVEKSSKFLLPKNSRILETGGHKNRSRTMPKSELHSLIRERFGVSLNNIIGEYGMSELSSQAYAADGGSFQFPPWARAQIVSLETGREIAEGETGLIHVFDLANVFSVAAIQTEDLAVRRGDGFELIGRAALAEPRGCSLMTV